MYASSGEEAQQQQQQQQQQMQQLLKDKCDELHSLNCLMCYEPATAVVVVVVGLDSSRRVSCIHTLPVAIMSFWSKWHDDIWFLFLFFCSFKKKIKIKKLLTLKNVFFLGIFLDFYFLFYFCNWPAHWSLGFGLHTW